MRTMLAPIVLIVTVFAVSQASPLQQFQPINFPPNADARLIGQLVAAARAQGGSQIDRKGQAHVLFPTHSVSNKRKGKKKGRVNRKNKRGRANLKQAPAQNQKAPQSKQVQQQAQQAQIVSPGIAMPRNSGAPQTAAEVEADVLWQKVLGQKAEFDRLTKKSNDQAKIAAQKAKEASIYLQVGDKVKAREANYIAEESLEVGFDTARFAVLAKTEMEKYQDKLREINKQIVANGGVPRYQLPAKAPKEPAPTEAPHVEPEPTQAPKRTPKVAPGSNFKISSFFGTGRRSAEVINSEMKIKEWEARKLQLEIQAEAYRTEAKEQGALAARKAEEAKQLLLLGKVKEAESATSISDDALEISIDHAEWAGITEREILKIIDEILIEIEKYIKAGGKLRVYS